MSSTEPRLRSISFTFYPLAQDKLVLMLTDGTRDVKLYHAPNIHNSGMLVGYVPDARRLFTADLVSDTFL